MKKHHWTYELHIWKFEGYIKNLSTKSTIRWTTSFEYGKEQ